jgi:hypothetical protein
MAKDIFKRATAADAKKAGALGLFRRAAEELEAAAREHREVSAEADDVANAYRSRAGDSVQSAVEAEQAAARLREMVG